MKERLMKERLIKEANEVIEAMEYFKSFIEKIPEKDLELNTKFYMIETDLIMFKNKFKKK
jgi:hypothetical protein